ncbi:stimulated by retinoic acid gene 8 protein homolog isoform X3 [Pyxicephalus adspersus]|uniref:stimulated by retinoic acid gene 8 protein homolog isoform X3 n=1 Tax=Pyxicephalus adspersus TaxID=30357 RepID=UPI003B5B00A2
MDLFDEGSSSSKKGKRRKGSGTVSTRKCPERPPNTSSIIHLIHQLGQIVFPYPNKQATRDQVLNQTKAYIMELENTLDSLLKMKGYFMLEDSECSHLKDVKEEYRQKNFCHEQGYLHFYRQTMDMLTESQIVPSEQVAQPVVSKAISNLWQDLKLEGGFNNWQNGIPQTQSSHSFCGFPSDLGYPDRGAIDNSAGSQEASGSFLSSTPEEVLVEDAFEVASSFLEYTAIQTSSSSSSLSEPILWDSPQGNLYLYQQVYDFLRSRLSSYIQTSAPQFDYEMARLRCTETFDDEDDL